MKGQRKRLGELLVEWGVVSEAQLEAALAKQREDGTRLGVALVAAGHLNGSKLTQLLSHQFGLPFVSLVRVNYTPELVAKVPGPVAHDLRVVPICTSGDDVLFVATDDPTPPDLAEQVSRACGLEARLMVAAPDEVQHVMDTYYRGFTSSPPAPAAPEAEPAEPTGTLAPASRQPAPKPPSVEIEGRSTRTGHVVRGMSPYPFTKLEPEVVEVSVVDAAPQDESPIVLLVSPDKGFEEQCRKAALAQGLRLEAVTLVTATDAASRLAPIAIVMKEHTFAFDRVAFTKLSMRARAHLIIWSDELEPSYLEALFATARSGTK